MKINGEALLKALVENETSLSNWGFCLGCGHQQDGCEPDTRNSPCEQCNERLVFGAEEILILGDYDVES